MGFVILFFKNIFLNLIIISRSSGAANIIDLKFYDHNNNNNNNNLKDIEEAQNTHTSWVSPDYDRHGPTIGP